jgi:hypothetical protein
MTKEHKVLTGIAALIAVFFAMGWNAPACLACAAFGLYACRGAFREA